MIFIYFYSAYSKGDAKNWSKHPIQRCPTSQSQSPRVNSLLLGPLKFLRLFSPADFCQVCHNGLRGWKRMKRAPALLGWNQSPARNWSRGHHRASVDWLYYINMSKCTTGWWFQPLWKIWVRQLGWLFPRYGKIKKCSKPPTRLCCICC